jgi:hypothetical protein
MGGVLVQEAADSPKRTLRQRYSLSNSCDISDQFGQPLQCMPMRDDATRTSVRSLRASHQSARSHTIQTVAMTSTAMVQGAQD